MAEKTAVKKIGTRRRRKLSGLSIGLGPAELTGASPPDTVRHLQSVIERDGGAVLTVYREPFGGEWLALAALPIDQVEPTPFQRTLSDAHVRKLETVIAKVGRFLDPIIVVRGKSNERGARYWTPNGNHRLSAMRTLGAKTVLALVVPEERLAYRILALNTEKAHNLRERALEVIKMYEELAAVDGDTEEHYALEFEEPALITLGLCYLERPRFSGGAYHPILKRSDRFMKKPLREALPLRAQQAKTLLALDDLVIEKVEALKSRGFTSPYLKSFVVARINPLRFRPADKEPLGLPEVLERMEKAVVKLNIDRVKVEDLARAGAAPEE
ncbi:MAG TPA: ParB N-terminal domain-containing protein [Candidatus Eisenbacteria bacterium]|nr:ParB N-terminal domain-containing protein [Candidatus Eisenbacteria bacterium]